MSFFSQTLLPLFADDCVTLLSGVECGRAERAMLSRDSRHNTVAVLRVTPL